MTRPNFFMYGLAHMLVPLPTKERVVRNLRLVPANYKTYLRILRELRRLPKGAKVLIESPRAQQGHSVFSLLGETAEGLGLKVIALEPNRMERKRLELISHGNGAGYKRLYENMSDYLIWRAIRHRPQLIVAGAAHTTHARDILKRFGYGDRTSPRIRKYARQWLAMDDAETERDHPGLLEKIRARRKKLVERASGPTRR